MSKPVKEMMTTALKSRYSGVDSAVWIEFLGCAGSFRRTPSLNGNRPVGGLAGNGVVTDQLGLPG